MSHQSILVHGQAGSFIDLPLRQGPATGFGWQLQLPPGVERTADGPPDVPPPDAALGAASGARLRVTAPPGHHRIVARLIRPWEPDKALSTQVIDLIVEEPAGTGP